MRCRRRVGCPPLHPPSHSRPGRCSQTSSPRPRQGSRPARWWLLQPPSCQPRLPHQQRTQQQRQRPPNRPRARERCQVGSLQLPCPQSADRPCRPRWHCKRSAAGSWAARLRSERQRNPAPRVTRPQPSPPAPLRQACSAQRGSDCSRELCKVTASRLFAAKQRQEWIPWGLLPLLSGHLGPHAAQPSSSSRAALLYWCQKGAVPFRRRSQTALAQHGMPLLAPQLPLNCQQLRLQVNTCHQEAPSLVQLALRRPGQKLVWPSRCRHSSRGRRGGRRFQPRLRRRRRRRRKGRALAAAPRAPTLASGAASAGGRSWKTCSSSLQRRQCSKALRQGRQQQSWEVAGAGAHGFEWGGPGRVRTCERRLSVARAGAVA